MPIPTLTVMTARRLRRVPTPPEARLWAALRERQLSGLKFRRQHPIGPYVLDFYSPAARLAVEVDGRVHDCADQQRWDRRRDQWLAARGIRVLRVLARDVRDNLEGVLIQLATTAREAVLNRQPASASPHHHFVVPLPHSSAAGEERGPRPDRNAP